MLHSILDPSTPEGELQQRLVTPSVASWLRENANSSKRASALAESTCTSRGQKNAGRGETNAARRAASDLDHEKTLIPFSKFAFERYRFHPLTAGQIIDAVETNPHANLLHCS